MYRVGVVGLSWRHGRADALAGATIPRAERPQRLPELAAAAGARECVYLATCNRVEVAFVAHEGIPFGEMRRRLAVPLLGGGDGHGDRRTMLRAWEGEGAAEHLFLVTAGLDSARVGESEITGQVREAVDLSQQLGLVGPVLDLLFTEAFRVARRVRPVTEGRVGRVSLAQVAVRHVLQRLGATSPVSREDGGAPRVALVGVSPMTRECARLLADAGVRCVVVNRTEERAAEMARETGGAHRALDAFRAAPDAVEVIVLATGARDPVLGRADLERAAASTPSAVPPLIVDLAIPPNVAPEDAAAAAVPRIGMDTITTDATADRDRLLLEYVDARVIVDDALTDLRRIAAERLVGPAIADIHRRFRQTAHTGVDRLFSKELAGLGTAERDTVRRWAETLARRLAHLPSVGLRDLAFQAGPAAVEAFLAAGAPELAQEFRSRAAQHGATVAPDGGDEQ